MDTGYIPKAILLPIELQISLKKRKKIVNDLAKNIKQRNKTN